MSKQKDSYHIFSRKKGGWVIRKGERNRALQQFTTKKEAIEYGRKKSKEEKSELVIHRKDGSIQHVERYATISSRPIPKYSSTDRADINEIKNAVTAVYVLPKHGNWVVTKGGNEISPSSDSISSAINYAWDIRRERGTDVIVIDDEGNVLKSSDYSDFDDFLEDSTKIDR